MMDVGRSKVTRWVQGWQLLRQLQASAMGRSNEWSGGGWGYLFVVMLWERGGGVRMDGDAKMRMRMRRGGEGGEVR